MQKRNYWEKASSVGAFGPKVHVISRRMGKNTAKLFVTPVYEVLGGDLIGGHAISRVFLQVQDLKGCWLYESELSRAEFAESAEVVKARASKQRLEHLEGLRRRRRRAAKARMIKQ